MNLTIIDGAVYDGDTGVLIGYVTETRVSQSKDHFGPDKVDLDLRCLLTEVPKITPNSISVTSIKSSNPLPIEVLGHRAGLEPQVNQVPIRRLDMDL